MIDAELVRAAYYRPPPRPTPIWYKEPLPIISLRAAGEILHARLHSMPREIAILYVPGLIQVQETLDRWKSK